MNIACEPVVALLPNGKNAHINIQTPKYWHAKLMKMKKMYKNIKIICCYSLKSESSENKKNLCFQT